MFKDREFLPSPSRTYVAICNRINFDGLYFRSFILPRAGVVEGHYDQIGRWVDGSYTPFYSNTAATASWYFTNVLNIEACIDGCIAMEQYLDLANQDDIEAKQIQDDIANIFAEAKCGT